MKKIEIEIKDETAEALDRAIQSRPYHDYPKEQAYSMIIDAVVSEVQKLPLLSCCYCYVPPHCHPASWWV